MALMSVYRETLLQYKINVWWQLGVVHKTREHDLLIHCQRRMRISRSTQFPAEFHRYLYFRDKKHPGRSSLKGGLYTARSPERNAASEMAAVVYCDDSTRLTRANEMEEGKLGTLEAPASLRHRWRLNSTIEAPKVA
jgi:hypothetical protein